MGNEEDSYNGLEFKCVSVAGFKALDSEGDGIVESIVSVTGVVDNVRDVIAPGAYQKSLEVRTPKGVWHHDWKESVSKTLGIKELLPGDPELPDTLPNGRPWPEGAGALKVKTQFNLDTQRGREAYSDVMFFGDQQEWSIGYNVPVGGATRNQKSGIRTINKLDLYEYSPVLFGAMPAARTASVKEAQMAYKSIMQAEASQDVEDGYDEKSAVYATDGSERIYGYMENGMFTKAQVSVSSVQARKIHKTIVSLVDLLRETNVVDEEDEAVESPTDQQPETGEGTPTEEAGDSSGSTEAGPITDLVSESFPDDEQMSGAASDFDEALNNQDADALEAAIAEILDGIDEAVSDGEEASTYAPIGDAIRAAMEAANSWDQGGEGEDNADDTEGEPSSEEEKSFNYDGELKTISLDEIKSLMS